MAADGLSAEPLKGALIGAGRVTFYHLQAWEQITQAAIVAITDPDLEKARARAQEFGIAPGRVYASLTNLLQSESGLHFVDLATPPHARSEPTELAAAHGLHVLCQKPFAHSLTEAEAMIASCRRAGVVLSINENWRWRSWYRTIKNMIAQGQIGRPIYARISSHWPRSLPWRTRPPGYHAIPLGSGLLFSWGIHLIDVLRFLFGEADTVYARMARLDPNRSGDDRAVVTLDFGKLTAVIDISRGSYAPQGFVNRTEHNIEDVRIEGDAGAIVLVQDPVKGDLMRLTSEEGEWEQPAYDCEPIEAYRRSYVAAQRHFIECLLTGNTPETHGEDNLKTLAITLAAYYSAEHKMVVNLQDYVAAHTNGNQIA